MSGPIARHLLQKTNVFPGPVRAIVGLMSLGGAWGGGRHCTAHLKRRTTYPTPLLVGRPTTISSVHCPAFLALDKENLGYRSSRQARFSSTSSGTGTRAHCPAERPLWSPSLLTGLSDAERHVWREPKGAYPRGKVAAGWAGQSSGKMVC
jgi:hypothetical protein